MNKKAEIEILLKEIWDLTLKDLQSDILLTMINYKIKKYFLENKDE
jgi:hypothetical protein